MDQVWRHYTWTGDKQFLRDLWPAVRKALDDAGYNACARLAAGETVMHIGKDGSVERAAMAASAVAGADGAITYPAAQGSLLL